MKTPEPRLRGRQFSAEEGLQWIAVASINWVRPAAELAPAVPGRAIARTTRPLPDDVLRIVARGKKQDGLPEDQPLTASVFRYASGSLASQSGGLRPCRSTLWNDHPLLVL